VKRVRSFYADASALAKRYFPEPGAVLVDHLFANVSQGRLYVLNVGIAEVVSALVRKKNAGQFSPAALRQALANLDTEVVHSKNIVILETDNPLVTTGLPLIETYSINGTDAILLRSALSLAKSLRLIGDDVVLVTSDQRLLKAAQAEGLVTFNPETQTQADLDALLQP
jgi:predicted nucleic acid-binding protein